MLSSAISPQTHLMSPWTLQATIRKWWSVSFYFHSFHHIDLDTTNTLLCGIENAFSCRWAIDLFAKLWWLPSDWLNKKLDSVLMDMKTLGSQWWLANCIISWSLLKVDFFQPALIQTHHIQMFCHSPWRPTWKPHLKKRRQQRLAPLASCRYTLGILYCTLVRARHK